MEARIDKITPVGVNSFRVNISIPFIRKESSGWFGKEEIIHGNYLRSFRVKKIKDVESTLKALLKLEADMEALTGKIVKVD